MNHITKLSVCQLVCTHSKAYSTPFCLRNRAFSRGECGIFGTVPHLFPLKVFRVFIVASYQSFPMRLLVVGLEHNSNVLVLGHKLPLCEVILFRHTLRFGILVSVTVRDVRTNKLPSTIRSDVEVTSRDSGGYHVQGILYGEGSLPVHFHSLMFFDVLTSVWHSVPVLGCGVLSVWRSVSGAKLTVPKKKRDAMRLCVL